eukprot:COSAG02_NODE_1061_length_14864_cov_7.878090_10_plen_62_part_00
MYFVLLYVYLRYCTLARDWVSFLHLCDHAKMGVQLSHSAPACRDDGVADGAPGAAGADAGS